MGLGAAAVLFVAAVVAGLLTRAAPSRPAEAPRVLGRTYARGGLPGGAVEVAPAGLAPTDAAPIEPPPAVFAGPVAAPAPVPVALAQRHPVRAGGLWAVVVGIDDYPGSDHDLRFAVNDANDVDAALASDGVPADHRIVLLDGAARAATVRAALQWLGDHAGPDAVAVFSYAGHARSHGGGHESLVAADGVEIPDTELAGLLHDVVAGRMWVNLAACYGGGFTEVLRPGVVLTAAAPADQQAYESTTFERSYLGEYMVHRGMLSGGVSAVQPAYTSAHDAIAHDYPDRVPFEADDHAPVIDLRSPATTTTATRGGNGAGGSGQQPPAGPEPSPAPSSPPPAGSPPPSPPADSCANATLGIVRCGG